MAERRTVADRDDEKEKEPAGQITQAVAAVSHQKRRASDKVSSAATTIVATAVVLTICYITKPVLITLLVAILFAFLLEPIVNLFLRMKLPRPVGAFMSLLIVAGLLYGMTAGFYSKAVD